MLWAALKAQWALHCEARFHAGHPPLDDFVARWMGIVEVWHTEPHMSLSRPDLPHLLDHLFLLVWWGHVAKENPDTKRLSQKDGCEVYGLEGTEMGLVSGRRGHNGHKC